MNTYHRRSFDHVNIDRKFKLGLYKDTKDERWLKEYNKFLYQEIQNRAKFCPHFKK